jgi:hypothetical protein
VLTLQGLREPRNPETTSGLLRLPDGIKRQASMIGYLNACCLNALYTMAFAAAAAVPLDCLLRTAARER